jgi:hypothetical protein
MSKKKVSHGNSKTSPAVKKIVNLLRKMPHVQKVDLGRNTPKQGGGGGPTRVKIAQIPGGLKATVSTGGSVQDIVVMTTLTEPTAEAIRNAIT